MWRELESYKNHFLRKELKHLNPVAVTNLVQAELKDAQAKRNQCRPPKEGPEVCEASTYLKDRAQLAYGLGALPKLMSELQSDVPKVRWCAINSMAEFLLNPINAQRALRETEIVRLLKNALLRHQNRFTAAFRAERLLECFRLLSYYHKGAMEIAKHKTLRDSLYGIFVKDPLLSDLTATILRNVSEKPEIRLLLNEADSFEQLKEIFALDICRQKYPYNLWIHLSHFLEIDPEKGIALGFFEILHTRIVDRYVDYCGIPMKCFAFVVRCESGQRRFDEEDCVALLYKIMSEEKEASHMFEYVVMAFLHGLQSKDAMRRCRDFVDLPKLMTKYALKTNEGNRRLQLYALKALRQLGEMPSIKDYMRENCERNLRTMTCYTAENDCERLRLVEWLNRDIFESEADRYA